MNPKETRDYLLSHNISSISTDELNKMLSSDWMSAEYDDIVSKIVPELERRDNLNGFGSIPEETTPDLNAPLKFEPIFFPELSDDIKEYDWIWKDLFAPSHLFLFSALPKAGKTTMLFSLLKAINEGREFFGRKTRRVNTLVISEESVVSWQYRKRSIGNIPFYVFPRTFNKKLNLEEWQKFLDEIYDFCQKMKIELVIFDTTDKFWGVQDENSSVEINNNIPPLFKLTKAGICTVLVQHFRKSKGSFGTATRGSNAIVGSVDAVIEFDRYVDNDFLDKRRKLSVQSRLLAEPIELLGEYDVEKCEYNFLGDINTYKQDASSKYLMEMLPLEGKEGMTTNSIQTEYLEIYGKKKGVPSIIKDLNYLISKELVMKIEKDVRGKERNTYVRVSNPFKKVEDF